MAHKTTQQPKVHTLGTRPKLTPELVQKIVLQNTPDDPQDPIDPDTQLVQLGVVDDSAAADLQAGVQSDLNDIGWHIKQSDIESSPSTTVADCRDSVLANAF